MKCQFCGRDFVREVNKNMHEKHCKKKEDKIINEDKQIINKKKIITKSCEHDFVLLDSRDRAQNQAISQGYNAFCTKCKELT